MKEKKCFWGKDIDCALAHNIIKTRDDSHPVCFIKNDSGKYALCEHHPGCAWCKKSDPFEEKILRERIEPWLTSLFQSEHLSLLTGSGLTVGICSVAKTTVSDTTDGAGVSIRLPQGCPRYLKLVYTGTTLGGKATAGITLQTPSPRGKRLGDYAANKG